MSLSVTTPPAAAQPDRAGLQLDFEKVNIASADREARVS